jgi:hypothetical protein
VKAPGTIPVRFTINKNTKSAKMNGKNACPRGPTLLDTLSCMKLYIPSTSDCQRDGITNPFPSNKMNFTSSMNSPIPTTPNSEELVNEISTLPKCRGISGMIWNCSKGFETSILKKIYIYVCESVTDLGTL